LQWLVENQGLAFFNQIIYKVIKHSSKEKRPISGGFTLRELLEDEDT
jgi:hypothetical protein